jgi:hypothetical protein
MRDKVCNYSTRGGSKIPHPLLLWEVWLVWYWVKVVGKAETNRAGTHALCARQNHVSVTLQILLDGDTILYILNLMVATEIVILICRRLTKGIRKCTDRTVPWLAINLPMH